MGCITPFQKTDKKLGQFIQVPCGKCPECVKRRTSQWSFRLMQHEKVMPARFVTLTYDTDHVPISRNGFMTLDKTDLQKFFKRLRKLQPENKISYYAVGEYGSDFTRPHYHLILFNSNPNNVIRAWSLENRPIGHCHFGDVTGASVGYTLKYLDKFSKIPMHRNDDRQREFGLMSKGLGAGYLTPQMVKYHKADLVNRMNCVLADGKIISMPRYYKDKIYTEQERKKIAWHAIAENIKREQEYWAEQERLYGIELAQHNLIEQHLSQFKKQNSGRKNATL